MLRTNLYYRYRERKCADTIGTVLVLRRTDADSDDDVGAAVGEWSKADTVPLSWRMKQCEAMLDSFDREKTVLAIFPSRFIHAGPSQVRRYTLSSSAGFKTQLDRTLQQ